MARFKYTSEENSALFDTETGATIPNDPASRAYRLHVAPWLQAGNTPDPAPEQPAPEPTVLPTIEGTTDSEKLASVIQILQAQNMATGG